MIINGFQKMTLLDFPGKVACTVFTAGCNFRCPFCHNASLVTNIDKSMRIDEEEIFSYLEKRKGMLDGVCITGGEPLLQADIEGFIRKIKEMGYAVKLDTNGSFPEKLRDLCQKGLIDYVAMDVKNCMEKYSATVGIENFDTADVEESINFLMNGDAEYEFRTTVAKELHTVDDIADLSERISGAKKYFIQNFVDSGDLLGENLSPQTRENLEKMKNSGKKHIQNIELRGI